MANKLSISSHELSLLFILNIPTGTISISLFLIYVPFVSNMKSNKYYCNGTY